MPFYCSCTIPDPVISAQSGFIGEIDETQHLEIPSANPLKAAWQKTELDIELC